MQDLIQKLSETSKRIESVKQELDEAEQGKLKSHYSSLKAKESLNPM